MLNAFLILAVGVAGLLFFLHGRKRLPGQSEEERQLVDRAAEGDESAAKELVRRGQQEEEALRARAATDRTAAQQLLERKQQQLQALQWAEESLDAKAAEAGYSAAKTAEVRARIETRLREAARDIEWARERSVSR